MKLLIHLKQSRKLPELLITLFTLTCFTASPKIQAVSPPPDGGYPGGNTAEGQNALFSLTSGTYNTAVGLLALRSNTEGSLNTAIGAGTLLVNTGSLKYGHWCGGAFKQHHSRRQHSHRNLRPF